ncbi:MAG: hypothetical protein V1837_02200 [Candidatus Woesearchaeota archaeon]
MRLKRKCILIMAKDHTIHGVFMSFDLSAIEFSKKDMTRHVNLPRKMTADLAEFIGIMIGDGHLGLYIGKQRSGTALKRSSVIISCNSEERGYCCHIAKLFYTLFNLKLSFEPDPRSKAVYLKAHSKAVVQFLNLVLGIPINRKTDTANIPQIIKNGQDEFKYAFLKGLADTDFSVTFRKRPGKGHVYPRIKAAFKSRSLIDDLGEILKGVGFTYCKVYNEKVYRKGSEIPDLRHGLYLNGVSNFRAWCDTIGFSNPKFIKKVAKWNKEGVCPPGC